MTPPALAMVDDAVELVDDALAAGPTAPPVALVIDAAYLHATRGKIRTDRGAGGAESDYDAAEALLKRAESMRPTKALYETWAKLEEYRGNARESALFQVRARNVGRAAAEEAPRVEGE